MHVRDDAFKGRRREIPIMTRKPCRFTRLLILRHQIVEVGLG